MNHQNRNWRKAWTVDPSTLIAVHESGLRIVGKWTHGALDVEADNASLPVTSGIGPDDILALGRELGRRVEEGGRLLMEALRK